MKPGILALCLLSLAPPARGEGRVSLVLHFELAPSLQDCPSENAFRETVSRRLGYDPFAAEGTREIAVRIDKAGDQLLGRVDWRETTSDAQGHRSFSTKLHECSDLVEDMAFAVAVQIQLFIEAEAEAEAEAEHEAGQGSAAERARKAPHETEPLRPRQAPDSDTAPAPPSNSSRNRGVRVSIGAGPSLGFGLLPSFAVFGGGALALQTESMLLELDVAASLPRTVTRSDGSGFDASLYAVTANACYQAAPWFACALGRGGRLSVRGFGVDEPRSSSGWVGWLGGRVGARVPIAPHWALGVDLELAGALGTRRVELDGASVWERPGVSLSSGFSTHFLFP